VSELEDINMFVNIFKYLLVVQNISNDLIKQIRSFLVEVVLHIVMAAKGLVFLIREAEADFKAGQTGLLCFSYLLLKLIKVSYRSNYLVDATPNQPGSISPDKL